MREDDCFDDEDVMARILAVIDAGFISHLPALRSRAGIDRMAVWPFPHYTSPLWNTPQTVFGAATGGLEYVDSDRLVQWDPDGHRRARKAAETAVEGENGGGKRRTAAYWEAYLTSYYGRPVVLAHALAGVDMASGHPIYSLGFRYTEAAGREMER